MNHKLFSDFVISRYTTLYIRNDIHTLTRDIMQDCAGSSSIVICIFCSLLLPLYDRI